MSLKALRLEGRSIGRRSLTSKGDWRLHGNGAYRTRSRAFVAMTCTLGLIGATLTLDSGASAKGSKGGTQVTRDRKGDSRGYVRTAAPAIDLRKMTVKPTEPGGLSVEISSYKPWKTTWFRDNPTRRNKPPKAGDFYWSFVIRRYHARNQVTAGRGEKRSDAEFQVELWQKKGKLKASLGAFQGAPGGEICNCYEYTIPVRIKNSNRTVAFELSRRDIEAPEDGADYQWLTHTGIWQSAGAWDWMPDWDGGPPDWNRYQLGAEPQLTRVVEQPYEAPLNVGRPGYPLENGPGRLVFLCEAHEVSCQTFEVKPYEEYVSFSIADDNSPVTAAIVMYGGWPQTFINLDPVGPVCNQTTEPLHFVPEKGPIVVGIFQGNCCADLPSVGCSSVATTGKITAVFGNTYEAALFPDEDSSDQVLPSQRALSGAI